MLNHFINAIKATTVILFSFGLLLAHRSDSVSCSDEKGESSKIIDSYCQRYSFIATHGTIRNHDYYEWITCVFLLQALLFYVPHFIWEKFEAGKLTNLVGNLDNLISGEEEKEYSKKLINYLVTIKKVHKFYFFCFIACQVLHAVNIIGQIYFTDFFLGGEFFKYGIQYFNRKSKLFPEMANCTFIIDGFTDRIDTTCFFPLNFLHEKLYAILWFWFIFLAVVSVLSLIHSILAISSLRFRVYLLSAQAPSAPRDEIEYIVQKSGTGGLFLLLQLGRNINPVLFEEIMRDLAHKHAVQFEPIIKRSCNNDVSCVPLCASCSK